MLYSVQMPLQAGNAFSEMNHLAQSLQKAVNHAPRQREVTFQTSAGCTVLHSYNMACKSTARCVACISKIEMCTFLQGFFSCEP